MSIMPSPRRTSSRRPFGLGILPDARPVQVRDARPAWAAAVADYLTSRGHLPVSVDAATAWIESRGLISGCPCVSRVDWPAVNQLLKANAVPTPQVLAVEAALAAELP